MAKKRRFSQALLPPVVKASVAVTASLATGGTVGAGIVTELVTGALSATITDVLQQRLSRRQAERANLAMATAVRQIEFLSRTGFVPRADLFDQDGRVSRDAQEIFEGVFNAATATHEARKAALIGNIVPSLAYDGSYTMDEANLLLRQVASLSYLHLLILHIATRRDLLEKMRWIEISREEDISHIAHAQLKAAYDLIQENLLVMRFPDSGTEATVLDPMNIVAAHMALTKSGARLHQVLSLNTSDADDIERVAAAFPKMRPDWETD